MNTMTCLEDLPNELFYDLFAYLEVRDLYQSFPGLNNRFDGLLCGMKEIYLRINGDDDTYDEYSIDSSRITHVRLRNQCPNISFWYFRRSVHSISADWMSLEQVEELGKLINLKYLEVRSVHMCKGMQSWWTPRRLVLLKPSALPNLRVRSLLKLRFISVPVGIPEDFSLIIAAAPNLVHFKMKIFRFSGSTYSPKVPIHYGLRRLEIEWFIGINARDFEFYLRHVPFLASLHLSIGLCRMTTMNDLYDLLNKLASSITTHLLFLRAFSFSITVYIKSPSSFDSTLLSSIFERGLRVEQCGHRLRVFSNWTDYDRPLHSKPLLLPKRKLAVRPI